jgi:hypothetical protein
MHLLGLRKITGYEINKEWLDPTIIALYKNSKEVCFS